MRSFLVFILVQLIVFNAFPQEFLNDLEINPVLVNKEKAVEPSYKAASIKISLPFFDDFSYESTSPNADLWVDDDVFINQTYAVNPPSIGVATFDAVNANGFIHESLSVSTSPSDRLTSQYIDLSTADQQTTYLSFYYQPQGLGNAPEFNDSLVLNIVTPDSIYRIWHANGTDYESFVYDSIGIRDSNFDTLEFKLVHLKLENPEYFTDSSQLQFINYANIPSIGARPSDRTNKDHWHIDYVMLADNRSEGDTIPNDMAMVEAPSSFMRDYSALPWAHYSASIERQLVDVKFHVRNNHSGVRSMNQLVMNISDIGTGAQKDPLYISQNNFSPFENKNDVSYSFPNIAFDWYDAESAEFEISGTFETTANADVLENNTAKRVIKFHDYYAYDDGTAEKVYGHSTDRARVAYKYTIFKGDSLKAVQMYFVRNKEEFAGVENFTLCIWDDYDDEPGELLRAETGKRPEIKEELNGFSTIHLDSALFVEGTFYIGWKQTSDLLMSVGYDANTKRRERIFYNVNSTWYNSDYNGSLMMRPVFGEKEYETAQQPVNKALEIMPNPSAGSISIMDNDGEEMQGIIYVFNSLGVKVYEQSANTLQSIDLGHLNNGMYIVSFFPNNAPIRSTRLIISK